MNFQINHKLPPLVIIFMATAGYTKNYHQICERIIFWHTFPILSGKVGLEALSESVIIRISPVYIIVE